MSQATLGPPRQRQLREVWSLPSPAPGDPGVQDVEVLCRAVLIESLRRYRLPVPDQDFQDALAHLLGEVVVLHARYVPAHGRELGPYLYQRLRLRLIDHWRKWYGRDGRHRLPAFEPGALESTVGDEDHGPRRPDGPNADPTGDWIADLGWLHPVGDREGDGAPGGLGVGAGDGASPGDRGAGARAQQRATARVARAPRIAAFADCPSCGWREYATAPNGVAAWHYTTCSACGAELEVESGQEAAA